MSDHEKPAWMTDDQVEAMAWELEVAMMRIRKDPRAALADGLAKIRATMLAEYKADAAKRKADLAKADAEYLAKADAELRAKMAAAEAKLCAKMEAIEAKIEAEFAAAAAEIRAALAEPLRRHNAAEAEPDAAARALQ
jgi:hypothetical protein